MEGVAVRGVERRPMIESICRGGGVVVVVVSQGGEEGSDVGGQVVVEGLVCRVLFGMEVRREITVHDECVWREKRHVALAEFL